jgi:cadmium resistance protein CadD (predicted permease)
MSGIAETVATAAGMFAGTNVDDTIVLTVLFLSSRVEGKPKVWQIWAGQYLGVAALVAVSVVAALGLTIIPDDYVGLLGLGLVALGGYGLVAAIRNRDDDDDDASPALVGSMLAVAGITIANGADNLAVYTSVFRTIGPGSTIITIVVFGIGVAIWCVAGSLLGAHKRVINLFERYGDWLVPAVFIIIGGFIVVESGALAKIT